MSGMATTDSPIGTLCNVRKQRVRRPSSFYLLAESSDSSSSSSSSESESDSSCTRSEDEVDDWSSSSSRDDSPFDSKNNDENDSVEHEEYSEDGSEEESDEGSEDEVVANSDRFGGGSTGLASVGPVSASNDINSDTSVEWPGRRDRTNGVDADGNTDANVDADVNVNVDGMNPDGAVVRRDESTDVPMGRAHVQSNEIDVSPSGTYCNNHRCNGSMHEKPNDNDDDERNDDGDDYDEDDDDRVQSLFLFGESSSSDDDGQDDGQDDVCSATHAKSTNGQVKHNSSMDTSSLSLSSGFPTSRPTSSSSSSFSSSSSSSSYSSSSSMSSSSSTSSSSSSLRARIGPRSHSLEGSDTFLSMRMLDSGLEDGTYHHDVITESTTAVVRTRVLQQFLSDKHEMVQQADRLKALLQSVGKHPDPETDPHPELEPHSDSNQANGDDPLTMTVDDSSTQRAKHDGLEDEHADQHETKETEEAKITTTSTREEPCLDLEVLASDRKLGWKWKPDQVEKMVKGLTQLPTMDSLEFKVDGHLKSNSGLKGIPFHFLSMSPDVWVALEHARQANQLHTGQVPYDRLHEGYSRSASYTYPRWLKSVKQGAVEVSKLWKFALVQDEVQVMDLCRVGGLLQVCTCALVRDYVTYRADTKTSSATLRANLNQIKSFHRLASRAYTKRADAKQMIEFGPEHRYHLTRDILTHEVRKVRDSGELDNLINIYTKRTRSSKASQRSRQRSNYRLLMETGQILSLDVLQTTCIALYDLIDATLKHAQESDPPLAPSFFNKKRCHKMREWICTLLLLNLKGNRPQVATCCCVKDIRMVSHQPSLTFDTLVEKTNSRRHTYHLPISLKFYRLMQTFLQSRYFVGGRFRDHDQDSSSNGQVMSADTERWRYTHVLARRNEHNHIVGPAPNFVTVALRNTWTMLHPDWKTKCPTPTILRKSWATIHFQQWLDKKLWPNLETKESCLSHLAARMNTSAEELCKTYILVDIRERDAGGEVNLFARPAHCSKSKKHRASLRHSLSSGTTITSNRRSTHKSSTRTKTKKTTRRISHRAMPLSQDDATTQHVSRKRKKKATKKRKSTKKKKRTNKTKTTTALI